jgi:septal ring factor EnvC (AmiA/AmiB activator)
MKNLQQNILIVLALALCGLCVFQWRAETLERNEIGKLNQLRKADATAIQGYTNSMALMDAQIGQLTSDIARVRKKAAQQEADLQQVRRELMDSRAEATALTNAIAQYSNAVQSLDQKLKAAYDGIKKQGVALQTVVSQRDDFVTKYNDSVKDRNAIIQKYNDLAAELTKERTGKK